MSVVSKDEMLESTVQQLLRLFGSAGSSKTAVMYSKQFYLDNKYFEYMVDRNVSDVAGVTMLVMTSISQTFLTMFDMIYGIHKLEYSEEVDPKQYTKVVNQIDAKMKDFLYSSIKATIDNARRLEEPKEWNPVVLPLINEMLEEKYQDTLERLKKVGHDCFKCHIYQHRKQCEIWQAIPKPIGFSVDEEDEKMRKLSQDENNKSN